MKKNLHFKHSRLNYINNQQQNRKGTYKISNSLYGHRCRCVLCCIKESRVVENIESDVGTLKILTAMQKS